MSRETILPDFSIKELDEQQAAAITVIHQAFTDRSRYDLDRLQQEVQDFPPPLYRKFFVAVQAGKVVGVAGVKAADWASHTHVLYLSAVLEAARGQGIGAALVATRLAWIKQHFDYGRILVSTHKVQRFRKLGFKPVSKERPQMAGRRLLCLEF